MNKRAQITAFIVIGIIMILSVMFFFYMKADIEDVGYEENVPEGLIPLKRFVEECTESNLRDALTLVGSNAGYIYLPKKINLNPFAKLPISREAEYYVPFWYYRGGKVEDLSPPLCKPGSDREGSCYSEGDYDKVYGAGSIQQQLEDYLEITIPECIDNFSAFDRIYEIEELSTLLPKVKISDESVSVLLDYALIASDVTNKAPTSMKRFRIDVPIRLGRVYDLARKIFDAENKGTFLENITFDLMSLSEDVFPITDVQFKCDPFVRLMSEVKNNIKNIVNFNYPYIRINNTDMPEFILPDETYAKAKMTMDLGLDKDLYDEIAVNFDYEPSWPMLLQISPNKGYYIQADPLKIADVSTCYMNYHFLYDVDFPITVTLVDQDTATHEAFAFKYAIPVLINHNRGDRIERPVKLFGRQVDFGSSETYCKNYPKRTMRISAVDEITYDDIYHVNVSFQCINFVCDVGEINLRGTGAFLDGEFPACNYGTITATKNYDEFDNKDYFDAVISGVNSKTQSDLIIKMKQKKKLNLTVAKYEISDIENKRVMSPTGVALIEVKSNDYEFEADYFYDTVSDREFVGYIDLLGGDDIEYEFNIMMVKDGSFIGGLVVNKTFEWRDLANAQELEIPVVVDSSLADDVDDYEAQFMFLENMTLNSKLVEDEWLIR